MQFEAQVRLSTKTYMNTLREQVGRSNKEVRRPEVFLQTEIFY